MKNVALNTLCGYCGLTNPGAGTGTDRPPATSPQPALKLGEPARVRDDEINDRKGLQPIERSRSNPVLCQPLTVRPQERDLVS